jgi:hypothetical protein
MNSVSKIDKYGDIRCPFCGLWIMAPPGLGYRAGVGLCKLCGNLFILTAEAAKIANGRLDSTAKINGICEGSA